MLDKDRVIAGKYRLKRVIGEGGIGAVWEATHLTLDAPVAIKFIDCGGPRGAQIADRFLREARISAAVRHRNVVQIMDFGSSEDGPYMVMEYLEGRSLGSEFKKGPMPIDRVVEIAAQVLSGLTAVHDAGIVHKDLKPENVYLVKEADGYHPKILDFGVSKGIDPLSGPRSAVTTQSGALSGTPQYMSPEQARGIAAIDQRSDIYSLGVIMYEALTGKVPFYAEHVGDLIVLIVTSSTPQVIDKRPDVGKPLSDLIAKAMARQPSDRFDNARLMLESLRTLIIRSSTLDDALVLHTNVATISSSLPPFSKRDHGAADATTANRSKPADLEAASSDSLPVSSLQDTIPRFIRSKRLLWISTILGIGALVTAALFSITGNSKSKPSEDNHRGNPTGRTAVIGHAVSDERPHREPSKMEKSKADPSAEPPADAIVVRLKGVDEKAQVFLDGEQSTGTEIKIPRDHRPHRIRVTRPGFRPWNIEHTASADGVYDVELSALSPPKKSPRQSRANAATKARKKRSNTNTKPKIKQTNEKSKPGVIRDLDF